MDSSLISLSIPYRVIVKILSYIEFFVPSMCEYKHIAFYFKQDICRTHFTYPTVWYESADYYQHHRPLIRNIVSISVNINYASMIERMVKDMKNVKSMTLFGSANKRVPKIYSMLPILTTLSLYSRLWWTPDWWSLRNIQILDLCTCSIPLRCRATFFKNILCLKKLRMCGWGHDDPINRNDILLSLKYIGVFKIQFGCTLTDNAFTKNLTINHLYMYTYDTYITHEILAKCTVNVLHIQFLYNKFDEPAWRQLCKIKNITISNIMD